MPEYTSAPFTFVKQGVFYFSRRVPKDLSPHYTSSKIAFSLRTRSPVVAKSRASRAAQQLDEHWYHLRIHDFALPGKHLLRMGAAGQTGSALAVSTQPTGDAPKLSEAVSIYLRLKGKNRPITFHRAAERSCGYVIDVCGDRNICSYTKGDANSFRDALLERELTGSSITRIFGTVRSVISFAASEIGVTLTNPFSGVYYDRTSGVEEREPLPLDAIREVQAQCREIDDDLRWLVALISDTGMRLAEAAGLLCDDLVVHGPVPHVVVREHPGRRLKTSSSARSVPLVGAALWAAQRILEAPERNQFAFPRYNRDGETNANSASAALNKWIKTFVPNRCTMHSFRHSMRDRLRAIECPADIVDQIGGWQTEGVGHGYGKGYPLEVLTKWMKAAA